MYLGTGGVCGLDSSMHCTKPQVQSSLLFINSVWWCVPVIPAPRKAVWGHLHYKRVQRRPGIQENICLFGFTCLLFFFLYMDASKTSQSCIILSRKVVKSNLKKPTSFEYWQNPACTCSAWISRSNPSMSSRHGKRETPGQACKGWLQYSCWWPASPSDCPWEKRWGAMFKRKEEEETSQGTVWNQDETGMVPASCVLQSPRQRLFKEENPDSPDSEGRGSLAMLYNPWCRVSRQGSHLWRSSPSSKQGPKMLTSWVPETRPHPSIPTPEREGAITSILIYTHLQSGYEVIRQERRLRGAHMLLSSRRLWVNSWNLSWGR